MDIREPKASEKELFNAAVTHPLQSWEWGEFREKTGIKVIRRVIINGEKIVAGFTITIHRIPRTSYTLGYIPKSTIPTKEILDELKKIGKHEKCIFIKLEPDVKKENKKLSNEEIKGSNYSITQLLNYSPHPLFTRYTFQLDLTKSEEELLKNMHSKTRYNIRVAEKHGVIVEEDNSDKAFESYIKLMHETTERQKYYAHTEDYHRKMWETLRGNTQQVIRNTKHGDELSTHLLVAKYKNVLLVTWIVFRFHDVLYYPYGASSSEYREVMASNLMMWEAIRFGKKIGCKSFDMWGSLGPNPDTKDPWYGFHRFKEGYGTKLVEFMGSYDLVINQFLYKLYNLAHRARWLYLRLRKT